MLQVNAIFWLMLKLDGKECASPLWTESHSPEPTNVAIYECVWNTVGEDCLFRMAVSQTSHQFYSKWLTAITILDTHWWSFRCSTLAWGQCGFVHKFTHLVPVCNSIREPYMCCCALLKFFPYVRGLFGILSMCRWDSKARTVPCVYV